MLFNSLEFLLFLPTVFAAYWILNLWTDRPRGLQAQNLLLLIASYVFYGWWDWRFLSLIAFSTLVDFAVGLQIAKANARDISSEANDSARSQTAKRWLWVSLAVNLGLLGYFKYANFFIENWIEAWSSVGVHMDPWSLKVILPVGISFYTFQTLSYSIDIYRRRLEPTKNLVEFAAFVSFFPQLVAGPIERASALLPQLQKRRVFETELGNSGARLILWGLMKKIALADTCAIYVNDIFGDHSHCSGLTLVIGAVLFAIQIYGDFSGYSDIAIGTARLFGIRLMTNFQSPYFSRDIADFWRRWHVSLSTWFRDYVYIPLGGSRVGTWKAVRNTFIIFLVSGFWHGANWTFVAWGALHALLFMPLLLSGKNRRYVNPPENEALWPGVTEVFRILSTFLLVTFAWVFFRSESIADACNYLSQMSLLADDKNVLPPLLTKVQILYLLSSVALVFTVEYPPLSLRLKRLISVQPFFVEPALWATCVIWLAHSPGIQKANQFIYFQF